MVTLRTSHFNAIIAQARAAQPAECCGLVGGSENNLTLSIYPLRNVAGNPSVAYEAAPEELFIAQKEIRRRGEQLLAVYHSHPRAVEPVPSDTDVRLAFYPSATYLIVGLGGSEPVMQAFRISEREQRWQQVEYQVRDE